MTNFIKMGALAVLFLAVGLWAPGRAWADALVITKAMAASTVAEVFIEENAVRIDLEIGVADLAGFKNLLPDPLIEKMSIPGGPLKERLPRFFLEDLTVRADDGPPLRGFVEFMEGRTRMNRDEITGEPLPVEEGKGDVVVFAKLVYPLDGRPGTLSIKPPLSDKAGSVAANIGFTTYHHGLPVMDFRYLGKEETVVLDWEDPWYSQFENRNLWRSYREPINAFLYVEPYEVRAEVIVRPYDMQQWIDLGIEGLKVIPVDRQPEIKQKIADFIAARLNLTIDGRPVAPALDRINFLRRTLRNSTVIEPPEELDVYSATLGVIFVQPTRGLPREASITWDLFSPKMDRVRAAATDEAGPLPYYLTPGDTVLTWKNFLKQPTIPTLVDLAPPPPAYLPVLKGAAGLGMLLILLGAGRAALRRRWSWKRGLASLASAAALCAVAIYAGRSAGTDRARAEAMLSTLLKNVYHAFDFREENLIYDTLGHSIDGDLLATVYLETRRGLELANQGGARVKVKAVDIVEVEPRNVHGTKGLRTRCVWNVNGSVGHWGHIHTRTNQYEAVLTLEPVDGVWKITGLDLMEKQRVL